MDEFATLEQLEALVDEMMRERGRTGGSRDPGAAYTTGGVRAIPRDILEQYRGMEYDPARRYRFLTTVMLPYLRDNFPEVTGKAVATYETKYGQLPQDYLREGDLVQLRPSSRFFTEPNRLVSETSRSADDARRGFEGRTGNTRPAPTANEQRGVFESNQPGGAGNPFPIEAGSDPALEALAQSGADQLARLEEDRAVAQAALSLEESRLRKRKSLQDRANKFNRATALRNGAPLTPTRGNINSGFQQGRRNVAVTAAGFQDAAADLAFSQALEDIALSREAVERQYSRGIADLANRDLGFEDVQSKGTDIPSQALLGGSSE